MLRVTKNKHEVFMKNVLVYDLPQRIFHWLFVGLFLTSFIIGKTFDDESITYGYHMISGILMTILVILRIFWGFVGPKHSRFSQMPLGFTNLKNYFANYFNKDSKFFAGHNPASAHASLFMYLFALTLGLSGYFMVTFYKKHFFEEIHEMAAHLFLLVVIFHVGGIILHTIKKNDFIALSMITGKKKNIDENEAIKSPSYISGIVLIAIFVGFASMFVKNYNTSTGELSVFTKKYSLVEVENENEIEREDDD